VQTAELAYNSYSYSAQEGIKWKRIIKRRIRIQAALSLRVYNYDDI